MLIDELVLVIKTDIAEAKAKIAEVKRELKGTGEVAKNVGKQTKESMEQMKDAVNKAGESANVLKRNMKQSMGESTSSIREAQSSVIAHQRAVENLNRRILDEEEAHQRQRDAIRGTAQETKNLRQRISDYIKQAQYASGIKVHSEGYKELQESITSTQNKLSRLTEKARDMQESGKDLTVSKEYKEISKAVESAQRRLNNFLATEERIKETGGTQRGAQWDRLQYNIEEARNTLHAYQQDLENLIAENGHLAPTEQFSSIQRQMQTAREEIASYQQQMESLSQNGQDAVPVSNGLSSGSYIQTMVATAKAGMTDLKNSISQGLSTARGQIASFVKSIPVIGRVTTETAYIAGAAFRGLSTGLSMLGTAAGKAGGFFKSLGSKIKSVIPHIDSTKKSAQGLDLTANALSKSIFKLGNMFKSMLVRMAMRAVIQGVKEGFQNLAKYSNDFNKSMSMLMSSMTQLKNSFATAFAPLINAVAPILNKIIQLFIKAANAIGQFFAALTGKGFYVKAKAVQQDYAKSLAKASGSAKKAKKAADEYKKSIMGFDELNPLTKQNKDNGDNSGSGSDSLSPSDMFETVPVESKFQELAEKLKKIWAEIFAPMKAAWETYGEGVIKAWKEALENVLSLAESIGKSFLDVWTNGTGEEFCGNILKLITEIGLAVGDVAKSFKNAWDDDGRGTQLIQSYFDKWNSILELILSISRSMRTVWNSGSGEKIIANILEIWTDIEKIIGNIADGLKDAWNLDGTGTKILQDIVDIFQNLLEHVNKVTKSLESWTKNLDFSSLLKSIQGITEALKPLGDKIGAGLEWFFKNVLEPLGKWAIEQAIPAALNAVKGALEFLDAILESLKPLGEWLWNKFLEPLGKWTGGLVVDILNGIGTAFSDLADIISDSDGFLDALVNVGGYLIEGLKNGIVSAIKGIGTWIKSNIIDPVVDAVKELFGIHSPSTVFAEIGGYLIAGLKKGITDKWQSFISFVQKLPSKIVTAFGNIKTKFLEKGNDIVNGIKKGWSDLASDFETTVGNWKNNVITWFGDIKTKFTAKGNDIINGIKEGWSSLSESFKSTVSEWKNKTVTWFGDIKTKFVAKGKDIIKGIKEGWNNNFNSGLNLSSFLSGIPEKIKKSIGSLYDIGKGIIQSFIKGFQSLKIPTPHFKKEGTVSIAGIDTPIPKIGVSWYAKGGIVDKPTLSMIGEAGKEAVVPLENNTGWITELSQKIVTRMDNTGTNTFADFDRMLDLLSKILEAVNKGDTILMIGDEEIARAVNRGQKKIARRTSPIQY
ncbi:MAG: hypothetical protein KH355_03055 [Clostridiales bacterium]|nr:hypothetical protein [Clostridiales bacterium]